MEYSEIRKKIKEDYKKARDWGTYRAYEGQAKAWKSEGLELMTLLTELSIIAKEEKPESVRYLIACIILEYSPEKFSDLPKEYQTSYNFLHYLYSKRGDKETFKKSFKEARPEFFDGELAERFSTYSDFSSKEEFFNNLPREVQTYEIYCCVNKTGYVSDSDLLEKGYTGLEYGWTLTDDKQMFHVEMRDIDKFMKTGKIEDMPVRSFKNKERVLELVHFVQNRKKKEATELYKQGKLTEEFYNKINTYGVELKHGIKKGFEVLNHLEGIEGQVSGKLDSFLNEMGVSKEKAETHLVTGAGSIVKGFLAKKPEEIVAECLEKYIDPKYYCEQMALHAYVATITQTETFIKNAYADSVSSYKGDEFLTETQTLLDSVVAQCKSVLKRNYENETNKEDVDTIIDNFDDIILE